MTNCLGVAKILDRLTLELIEKSVEIPQHVTDGLKSVRTLARISSRDLEDKNLETRARIALENVEMNLLSLAEINLGLEAAKTWQLEINNAYLEETVAQAAPVSAPKFGSGVPRGDHWVRLQSDYMDTVEGVEQLMEGFNVSVLKQEDGYLLIHGRKENVSAFMKELREKIVQK